MLIFFAVLIAFLVLGTWFCGALNIINVSFLIIMTGIVIYFIMLNFKKIRNLKNNFEQFVNHDLKFLNPWLEKLYDRYINSNRNKDQSVNADISEYINIPSINSYIKKPICDLISPMMTGFGLLGTFIGLIVGLKGFNTEYEYIQGSISGLLDAIKTAFITSIYGVSLSLYFNYFYHKLYLELKDSYYSFKNKVENSVLNVNYANTNFELINSNMSGINKNTELILKSITEDVTEQFKKSIDSMSDTVVDFMKNLSSEQYNQLKMLVKEYLKEMNEEILNGELSELRSIITEINQDGEKISENMRSLSDTLNDTTNTISNANSSFDSLNTKYMSYIDKVEEYQNNITESNNILNEKISIMTDRYSEQNDIITKMNETNVQMSIYKCRFLKFFSCRKTYIFIFDF